MFNVIFGLIIAPVIFLLVFLLLIYHLASNAFLRLLGKPTASALQAKSVRFCDRLKEWIIEHE